MNFGSILKELRLKARIGLRRFAELIEMQPSNLSAIENGRRLPPTEEEKLRQIALTLGLTEGSDDWLRLFDAARRTDSLPADVQHLANRPLVPALLRTIDNCQLTEEQVNELMQEIKQRYGR